MKDQYVDDEQSARIYDQLVNGQRHEHYLIKDGFLMTHGRLCITKQLRPKVMQEIHAPLYECHRGIDATVKVAEHFFHWPTL